MLAGGRKSNLGKNEGGDWGHGGPQGEDEWDPRERMEGGMQERGGGPRERAVESQGSWWRRTRGEVAAAGCFCVKES